jgi:hypothetical protein
MFRYAMMMREEEMACVNWGQYELDWPVLAIGFALILLAVGGIFLWSLLW